jgi:hypothetical protein
MTSVNKKALRIRIRELMEEREDTFTTYEIADVALEENILGSLGYTVHDIARQAIVAMVESVRKSLSSPPAPDQPKLLGLESIGMGQLFNLGGGESIWARNARHEHVTTHWKYVDRNADQQAAARDRLRKDLFASGIMDYLFKHRNATLPEACQVVNRPAASGE